MLDQQRQTISEQNGRANRATVWENGEKLEKPKSKRLPKAPKAASLLGTLIAVWMKRNVENHLIYNKNT